MFIRFHLRRRRYGLYRQKSTRIVNKLHRTSDMSNCAYMCGIIVNVNGIPVVVEFATCIHRRPLYCSYDTNSPILNTHTNARILIQHTQILHHTVVELNKFV